MVRLKHLASLRVECAANGERPYVALENITSWTGSLVEGIELPVRTPSRTGMASVEPGDVLFGKLRPYLAKTWLVDRPALASTELMCLRPGTGVDSGWLGYLTMATPFVEWAVATSEGTKMPRTSWQKVGEYRPWLPSGSKQRAIADYLDTETGRIDALITKKRRMIELLEARWIAGLVNATTSFGGDGSRVALRRLLDSTIGGAWGKDLGEDDLDALCIRGTDFDTAFLRVDEGKAPKRSFSYSDFKRRQLVHGDLVIEKSGGGDKQPVGRTVQWCGDSAGVPTNFAARLRPVAGVNSRYLAFLLRASYETGVTRRWIKQTTGIQNLDLGGFLSEKYAIPRPREQSLIAKRLDEATEHRSLTQGKLHTQIGLLMERRQGSITSVVTGELSVPGVTV